MASRGLALACVGRIDDAILLADDASHTTQSLEVAVLTAAIRAVVEVRARGESAFDAAQNLLDTAIQRGGLDLFVTCYRGSPDILRMLLASFKTSERAVFAIARAGDQELAKMLGTSSEAVFDPIARLSKREREVCALLCEGLSDREIGRLLFITPETAKRHALRVLQKTGFRSRRALVLGTVRKQLDHAAPTATRDDIGTSDVS
jgi:DNA-binding CsgD family transcriptional regulator